MMRKFNAITMAEMMIALLIMAILAVFALTTIKPQDKAYKWLYVRIYHSLEDAVYNSMTLRNVDGFPATSTDFCNMLKEYINTADEGEEVNQVNPKCEAGRDLTRDAADFPEDKIQLILSNGMRLWIGSNAGAPYVLSEVIDGNTATMKYYVVFADINGSKGPNLAQWDDTGNFDWNYSSKMVDIVAFVVTEASIVIPVGPPEIDTRYMQAVVIYPPDDENCPDCTRSSPNTYYWAKNNAWGQSKSIAEPMSLDFAGEFATNSPFTVSYPAANSVEAGEGCSDDNNTVSQCYVKIEEYN